MTMISRLPLFALALSLTAGTAFAQTAAPAAPAAPTSAAAPMAPMAKKGQKPRTAQSLECSKKADAANVHGKPRSAFMRNCKAGKA
jgi:hypothetical protein